MLVRILFLFLVAFTTYGNVEKEIFINSRLFKNAKAFYDFKTQAYPNSSQRYYGLYLNSLLKDCGDNSVIKIKCADGFEVEFVKKEIIDNGLNNQPVIFYDKNSSWPKSSKYGGYVGPYYMDWVGSKPEQTPREMRAWDVIKIECISSSGSTIIHSKEEEEGRKLFNKNCLGCHDISNKKSMKPGPNLLYPLSPLDYFKSKKILKRYIRNPQAIRWLNNDKMLGFSEKELSGEDLDRIISFLKKINEEKNKNHAK